MTARIDRTFAALLVGILAAGALLRVNHLDADPLKTLSWSQGIYTDGAVVVQNARNAVLWGNAVPDWGIALYFYPFSYAATLAGFKLLGVSTIAARLVVVTLGLAAIAAVALALRAEGNPRRALAAAAFLALSFPFTMYGRLPFGEWGMIFLASLAFLCFGLGSARGSVRAIGAAGFFAAAAPLFGKAHAVYLPIVGLGAMLMGAPEERSRTRFAWYVGGCVAALALWAALLAIPYKKPLFGYLFHEAVAKHEKSAVKPDFLVEASSNAISMGARSGFLARDFFVTGLGFAALPLLVVRGRAEGFVRSAAARFAALWLLLGWAFLSTVKFPAPRYINALFPPMAILAADLLLPAPSEGARTKRGARSGGAKGSSFGGGALAALFLLSVVAGTVTLAHLGALSVPIPALAPLAALIPSSRAAGYPWILVPIGALAAAAATALLARRGARPLAPAPRVAAAVVALSALLAGAQYAAWSGRPTRYLTDAGRALGRLLGPDAHLVGAYAPALCLDNRLRASPYYGPEDFGMPHDPDLFAAYGITHAVLTAPGDFRTFAQRYPEIAAGVVPVARYPFDSIYSREILVFRVPAVAGGRTIHSYQPTEAERASEASLAREAAAARGAPSSPQPRSPGGP